LEGFTSFLDARFYAFQSKIGVAPIASEESVMAKKDLGTALITGASSGIGAIYADRLAHRGYNLILVARNQERLEALASRLRKETNKSIEIVKADLGKKEDLARVEEILRTKRGITMLGEQRRLRGDGPSPAVRCR
jgi:nucleoside-diphosphate-sugar epimerase